MMVVMMLIIINAMAVIMMVMLMGIYSWPKAGQLVPKTVEGGRFYGANFNYDDYDDDGDDNKKDNENQMMMNALSGCG